MRTFIAVEIPEEIGRAVGDYITILQQTIPHVKWVSPDNMHLTMKFLGEVDEKRIPELEEFSTLALKGFSPFMVEFSHLGFFPSSRTPRVFWIGATAGVDKLLELYQDLEESLEKIGFDREAKTFSPHLTIGRVKHQERVTIPTGIPEFNEVSFEVNGISLIKSTLTPQGPVYETLMKMPFPELSYSETATPGGAPEET
jgi:RNA 2',3'-cyclic 3'-phosphodiesterase